MKKLKGNDIYIQNNFIDDILENPVKFSYEQIMFISNFTLYDYDLYDYIVLNYPFVKGAGVFKQELIEYGVYDDYLNSVMEEGDIFLKASFAFYIDASLRDDVIGDEFEFIDTIKNDDEYPFEYKVGLLTALAIYKNYGELINIIKNNIINIVKTDDRIKKEFSNEERDYLLNQYLSAIDENTIDGIKRLSNKM